MVLISKWHEIRSDFEQKLYTLTNDEYLLTGFAGTYKANYFKGHCSGEGGTNYRNINATSTSFKQVPELYTGQQ